MNIFEKGDIVKGSNPWLNSLLGISVEPGVVLHHGEYSSIIYLFIRCEDTILMNEYIEKISDVMEEDIFNIGDLVELKAEINKLVGIKGAGIIIDKTTIISDYIDEYTDSKIDAYLIYFPDCDTEYTIPYGCVKLFLPSKRK